MKPTTFTWMALAGVALLGVTLAAANEKPTPEYQGLMKQAGGALQSVGKNAEAKNYDGLIADAGTLKAAFAEVGKFWTAKKVDTALNACKATYQAATELETAAKAKNDDGIAAARKSLGAGCQSCHSQHREKTADGFQIKY
ncbi:MAG: hypothetical protein AB7N65_23675 [Vicinamibacterales bacterium]